MKIYYKTKHYMVLVGQIGCGWFVGGFECWGDSRGLTDCLERLEKVYGLELAVEDTL